MRGGNLKPASSNSPLRRFQFLSCFRVVTKTGRSAKSRPLQMSFLLLAECHARHFPNWLPAEKRQQSENCQGASGEVRTGGDQSGKDVESFAAQTVANLAYPMYHLPSDAQFERLSKGLARSRRQEAIGAVGGLYCAEVPIHACRLRIENRHEV
jgi:hypothetical protein